MKIKFDTDYSKLIIKMLKLEDCIITDKLNINSYDVVSKNIKATIYFEKQETEEDKQARLKEIESLENSIKRRENLLANQNYVSKAPANLVEKERETLKQEKEKLAILKK